MNTERGMFMEKFLKEYGVIILLYLVIIGGIIMLNERIKLLNQINNVSISLSK
jgi:hypothetical protein